MFDYKLGIIIPYWNNSKEAKELWLQLKENLMKQIDEHGDDVIGLVCEDDKENPHGLSYQRNRGINELINSCKYLLFVDSDDQLEEDYIEKMVEATETNAELLESIFAIRNNPLPFEPDVLKNRCTGIAIRNDVIGFNRFDEHIKFGEDKEFMHRIIDLSKMKKVFVDTTYYYNYGANPECITYRWSRGELK